MIPEENQAPEILEAADGAWRLPHVVTGGKAASLDEIAPLPELSPQNQQVVNDLTHFPKDAEKKEES